MTDFYSDLGLKTDNNNREIFINSPRNFLIEQPSAKAPWKLDRRWITRSFNGENTPVAPPEINML